MREAIITLLNLPWFAHLGILVGLFIAGLSAIYLVLQYLAPKPRLPLPSEKTYKTTTTGGSTATRPLPCWYDVWLAERQLSELVHPQLGAWNVPDDGSISPPDVRLSVVVPAYNEESRILPALAEAVEYLDAQFGRDPLLAPGRTFAGPGAEAARWDREKKRKRGGKKQQRRPRAGSCGGDVDEERLAGYEIIVVDDGSRDRTVDVVLKFAADNALHDIVRVVSLERNRGKGGAVTHGFRHARGEYVLFADADGASRFSDVAKLIEGLEEVVDPSHRGIAVGSRAHLVGSEAVVKRSALRNFLMRGFHFVLAILTPPATSRLRDTQCGFKLFSRAALPHVVPYMHAEGWIFDIEMLLLAESAPPTPVRDARGEVIGATAGIRVAEVPVAWHEVDGSKMNLVADSLRMAVGLAVLRGSWMLGVYRRRIS